MKFIFLLFFVFLPMGCTADDAGVTLDVVTQKLIDAARNQIGVTTEYDSSYTKIPYPGGDVSKEKGVCTDKKSCDDPNFVYHQFFLKKLFHFISVWV